MVWAAQQGWECQASHMDQELEGMKPLHWKIKELETCHIWNMWGEEKKEGVFIMEGCTAQGTVSQKKKLIYHLDLRWGIGGHDGWKIKWG